MKINYATREKWLLIGAMKSVCSYTPKDLECLQMFLAINRKTLLRCFNHFIVLRLPPPLPLCVIPLEGLLKLTVPGGYPWNFTIIEKKYIDLINWLWHLYWGNVDPPGLGTRGRSASATQVFSILCQNLINVTQIIKLLTLHSVNTKSVLWKSPNAAK